MKLYLHSVNHHKEQRKEIRITFAYCLQFLASLSLFFAYCLQFLVSLSSFFAYCLQFLYQEIAIAGKEQKSEFIRHSTAAKS